METRPWDSRLPAARGAVRMNHQDNKERQGREGPTSPDETVTPGADRRFYVTAPSVNAVRKALFRAPGGARVVGRHDRRTIACTHTMDARSFARHWPILLSRLDKAGLRVAARPDSADVAGNVDEPGRARR